MFDRVRCGGMGLVSAACLVATLAGCEGGLSTVVDGAQLSQASEPMRGSGIVEDDESTAANVTTIEGVVGTEGAPCTTL